MLPEFKKYFSCCMGLVRRHLTDPRDTFLVGPFLKRLKPNDTRKICLFYRVLQILETY